MTTAAGAVQRWREVASREGIEGCAARIRLEVARIEDVDVAQWTAALRAFHDVFLSHAEASRLRHLLEDTTGAGLDDTEEIAMLVQERDRLTATLAERAALAPHLHHAAEHAAVLRAEIKELERDIARMEEVLRG